MASLRNCHPVAHAIYLWIPASAGMTHMLLSSIDIYCERTDIGFWNEPVNALSNAAFLVAAALLCKLYKANNAKDPESALLIALVALVGAGSFLFHTFATYLTMLADVIPIGVTVFVYLWISLRRLLGFGTLKTMLMLIGFAAVAVATAYVPDAYSFNGSVGYFPCLAAIALIAFRLPHGHAARPPIFQAAACFTLSLTFRSLDMALCPGLPLGTHFLWHLLNGAVLYLLVKAVLCHCMPRQRV